MRDYSNISKTIRNTTTIIGDLILLAEVIQSCFSKRSKVMSSTPKKKKTITYNNHHNYSQRKAKALLQKSKDTELRDYILNSNKEWASSKLKETAPPRVKDDPFE